mmetsp:Transcript_18704/g.43633  ORF Transcript_18704/g.43633 Transcript_18704/m.43633 type:complete len:129 (-) Transcript_18704:451-837(-)
MDGLRAQAPMPGEPDAGAALPWRRAAAVVYASALGAQNVAGGSESFPLPQRGLTSRYRGVSLKSGQKSNPWKSVITVNNQTMHLGNFQSEERRQRMTQWRRPTAARRSYLCLRRVPNLQARALSWQWS